MKIIPFLLMLILAVQTPCFAEDIYIGTYDDSEFYLKDDSLSCTMNIVTGQANVIAVINYTVAEIPHDNKLKEMQDLMLDNTVTHRERTYRVSHSYNRIKKAWVEKPSYIEIKKSLMLTTNYKHNYSGSINSSFVCSTGSTKQDDEKYVSAYKVAEQTMFADKKKYFKYTLDGK